MPGRTRTGTFDNAKMCRRIPQKLPLRAVKGTFYNTLSQEATPGHLTPAQVLALHRKRCFRLSRPANTG